MTKLFARKITLRTPFVLKSLPFAARFYRFASRRQTSRKAQLLVGAPLEKLFAVYYRFITGRATGELEYRTAEGHRTIHFNARNLAFDMFYAEVFSDNYEDETGLLLDAFLPLNGCLYDIGSNWGFFSLYAASRGGSPTIHAFEPIPSTFADLKDMVAQAGMEAKVRAHNLALSDSEGEVEFQLPLHSAGAQTDPGVSIAPGSRHVRVRKSSLDALKLDRPDFIKLDAEWHEGAVLRGADATLRQAKPFLMVESKVSRSQPEQTLEPLLFLVRQGYQLFMPTVKRTHGRCDYLLNCGYQADTARNQRIEREDTLVLVPFEPSMRFVLPPSLNLFACHNDRMSELRACFDEITLRSGV